jgi:hypothetical protein
MNDKICLLLICILHLSSPLLQSNKVLKLFITLEEMGFIDMVNSCYLTRTLLHAVT